VALCPIEVVVTLDDTARKDSGFGSTGGFAHSG
jgi:dUTPase